MEGRKGKLYIPWGIDVCAIINEQLHDLIAAPRAGNVQRENAIEDRIDGLPVIESIFDEPQVTRGSC